MGQITNETQELDFADRFSKGLEIAWTRKKDLVLDGVVLRLRTLNDAKLGEQGRVRHVVHRAAHTIGLRLWSGRRRGRGVGIACRASTRSLSSVDHKQAQTQLSTSNWIARSQRMRVRSYTFHRGTRGAMRNRTSIGLRNRSHVSLPRKPQLLKISFIDSSHRYS